MTRKDMRELLQRRLSEPTSGGEWTDPQLNDLLNLALGRLQTVILKFDPDAFLSIVQRDIVVAQKFYLLPADVLYLAVVEIKDTTTSLYGTILPMKYQDTLTPLVGGIPIAQPALQRYARFGRSQVALYPIPSANVANGLQLTLCEALQMAADDTVPNIPLSLHMAVVMRAQLYAMGETGESMKDVKADLAELLAEIPDWYKRDIGENPTLDIDLGKQFLDGYSGRRTWPIGNGTDSRG